MIVVSKRMRLMFALEIATAAAEEFRLESAARFAADKKKWERTSRQRQLWEKRVVERLATIDAAIAAMRAARAASEKL